MDGETIDLTADEKPFYFNPYSGELSLKFPKAEMNCRGGILAQVLTHSPHTSFSIQIFSDGKFFHFQLEIIDLKEIPQIIQKVR